MELPALDDADVLAALAVAEDEAAGVALDAEVEVASPAEAVPLTGLLSSVLPFLYP